MSRPCIYLIGSLRDPRVPEIGIYLERKLSLEIFSDWYSASDDADDWLRDYYRDRGYNYKEMIHSHAAKHIFAFDKYHLDRSSAGILVAPAGKSCHLELGYLCGQGKPTYVLFDKEPDRVDIMYNFCTDIFFRKEDLLDELNRTITNVHGERSEPRVLGHESQQGRANSLDAFGAIGSLGGGAKAVSGQQVATPISRSRGDG